MKPDQTDKDIANLYDASVKVFRDEAVRLIKLLKSGNFPIPTYEELVSLLQQLGIKDPGKEAYKILKMAQEE